MQQSDGSDNKWEHEFRINLPQAGERWLRIEAVPQAGDDGHILWHGYLGDVTPERLREEAITILSERFRLAHQSAHIGVWEYDPQNGSLIWDEEMHELYGTTPESVEGLYNDWASCVFEEDLPIASAAVQRAIDDIEPYDLTFRIRRQDDGSVRWIHGRAVVLRNEEGVATRMIGVNSDVTQAQESTFHIERFFAMSPDVLGIMDFDYNLVKVNNAWTESLGYAQDQLVSQSLFDFIHQEDVDLAPGRDE